MDEGNEKKTSLLLYATIIVQQNGSDYLSFGDAWVIYAQKRLIKGSCGIYNSNYFFLIYS